MSEAAFTLYSEEGEVVGAQLANGEVIWVQPTPTLSWGWNEETASFEPFDVIWCGSSLRHEWSHTRGELLGDYCAIPSLILQGIADTFRVRIATWKSKTKLRDMNPLREEKE